METIRDDTVEQALLAHVLRHPKDFPALADIVQPGDFGWHAYGWAWEAMQKLTEAGLGLDTVTIGDQLERDARLAHFCPPGAAFAGRAALTGLREIRTTDTGESYAHIVKDYANKRIVLEKLREAAHGAKNGRTASAIISDLETEFGKLALGGRVRSHTMGMELAVAQALHATEQARGGGRAISTGLPDLDKYLGLQRQELAVVAARPGVGKSALLCTIAVSVAEAGKRVKLFSLEMGNIQVTQRLLAIIGDLSAYRIMMGTLTDGEMQRLEQATEKLADLPITLCDLPAMKIGQIKTEARRTEADVLMVDYIQLANADKKQDRRDLDIGEVTRGLKGLAKELDLPILAAAQLNRGLEGRSDKRPVLSDLRESGSIENDADSVLFIHREDAAVQLIIAKHRNGPVGVVSAYFREEPMQFVSATTRAQDFGNSRQVERKDLD